jgi:Tfp pilus assembly PilM family ATPase
MDLPIVSETKILEFVSRELGAFTEEAANDVFDYAVLNAKLPGGGARILAVAVDRGILQVYRNTFTSAGFNLKRIDIGVNAIIKLSRLLPQLHQGAQVLAALDDRHLSLSLFEAGEYKITNRYRLIAQEDTEEWRREIGDHISSVFQFHKGQRPEEEISGIFFAGLSGAKVAGLAAPLSFLDTKIEELDIAPHVSVTNKKAGWDVGFEPGKNLLGLGLLLKR